MHGFDPFLPIFAKPFERHSNLNLATDPVAS
jgi:hypothetical protein